MSSTSAAGYRSSLELPPDLPTDSAFWERAAAQLRQQVERMSSSGVSSSRRKSLFNSRTAAVKSPKSDINSLILDYLMMEGYPKAAEKFSKEANLQEQQEDSEIAERREIQNAIHNGDIEIAIAGLNQLDPEILDKEPKLHFSLLRLQLVELIRNCNNGDIKPALEFATQQLGPRASTDPEFLDALEKTMVLLIFPHDDSLQPELAALLRSDLRKQVADEVNRAIVRRRTQRLESAIQELVRMRAWSESAARANKKDVPDSIELGLGEGEGGGNGSGGNDDSAEPMVTI